MSMSRESYQEICPLYNYLYSKFGIRKEHLIQIFGILHLIDPEIPKLKRHEKRKKMLIIDQLNKHKNIIQQYILRIVPYDNLGNRISKIEKTKEIHWKISDELERPSIQAGLRAANSLNKKVNTNNLGQINNPNIQAEIRAANSLNQKDDTNNLGQINNPNIQAEIRATNSLNQKDDTNNLGQINNPNIQAKIRATNNQIPEDEEYFKIEWSDFDTDDDLDSFSCYSFIEDQF